MNLFEKRTALIEEYDVIMAKEVKTEEDEARLDAIDTEIEAVEKDIERAEKSEARKTKFKTPTEEPILETPVNSEVVVVGEDREEDKPFATLGHSLQAIWRASNPQSGVIHKRLRKLLEPETRAAGTPGNDGLTGADGGFLVETDQQKEVFQRVYDNSQVMKLVTPFTASSDSNTMNFPANSESSRADGSRFGGVQALWGAELGQLSASRPTYEEVELKLNKLHALFYASEEMLKDVSILDQLAGNMFAQEIAYKLQDAMIRGDGVGKPLGILNAGATVTVSAVSGQGSDTLLWDNVVAMWARMYAPSIPNSAWFINQDVYTELLTMTNVVGTAGVPVYLPASAGGTDGAVSAPFGTLMGRPIFVLEQCSTIGDKGDIILADMSQYYTLSKGGIETAMSIHLKFDWDQTAFRWITRFDGKPIWSTTLTPAQGSNTLSPFVMLNSTRT